MFGHLNDPSPPGPGPEDREAVMRRAQGIKRHRQMAMGVVAAALVVLIAVPAVALSGSGGSHRKVDTIGAPTTQSSEDTSTAPVAAGVVTPVNAPSSTVAQSSTTVRPTTTTALVCRNSTDPRCGPFRWDPAPAPNQPLTVSLTFAPANPRPGQVVHFYPVADDPDAAFITHESCQSDYGDNPNPPPCFHSSLPQLPGQPPPPTAYGPWTPPAPEHGHCPSSDPHPAECQFFFPTNSSRDAAGTCSIDHTYDAAGTYTVKLAFRSFVRPSDFANPGVQGLPDPYANTFTASVSVTVSGPPVTTTTTPGPRVDSTDC